MNRIYLLILFLTLTAVVFSCQKAPKPLTREQLIRQMDSTTNARIEDLYRQAQIDLERRIPIEVKAKADSIVNARMLQRQMKNVAPVKPAKNIPGGK